MTQLEKNSQHILLSVGFLNFPHISPDTLERVLTDFPQYEGVLPALTSNRCAFNKLKDELNGYKTPVGRLITNRGKAEELSKWTCFEEPVVDAFSILHAIASNEGHDAEPDGAIALASTGNILISTTAFLMCQKYAINPSAIFDGYRGVIDAVALRRAFVKFEKQLSVKAIKMNNGTLLIHPSLKDYVNGYLEALRALGVSKRFVSSWNIFANTDFESLKDAYVEHAANYLKGLELKLSEKQSSREATFKGDQQELKELLNLLEEYQISDTLIKEFARLDKMLDDSIAKISERHQNKGKTKQLAESKALQAERLLTSLEINKSCTIHFQGKYPKLLKVERLSYNPLTKMLTYFLKGSYILLDSYAIDVVAYDSLAISYRDEVCADGEDGATEVVYSISVCDGNMLITRRSLNEDTTRLDAFESTLLKAEVEDATVESFYQLDEESEEIEASKRSTYTSNTDDQTDIDNEPNEEVQTALSGVDISLKGVQAWVLGRAMEGKEAKYADAIELYGQATVDQAIDANLIFNYRGFLEEA